MGIKKDRERERGRDCEGFMRESRESGRERLCGLSEMQRRLENIKEKKRKTGESEENKWAIILIVGC
jgi:hypothetical protein